MPKADPPAAGPPLLATKLFVPLPRAERVSRPRLLQLLDQGLESRLVLVSAPAGFGKTTLLSEWLQTALTPSPRPPATPLPLSRETGEGEGGRGAGVRAAWLSLDAADNDPVHFLRYLVASLQAAVPGLAEPAAAMLLSRQPPPVEQLLTLLVNALCALPGRIVLVLDDYHLIEAPAVHQALSFLLDNIPPQLCVVVATRADPPLPLSRWRSRGQLQEVRAGDLRFTFGEAADFLNQVMGLNLAAPDIAALEERTEGWIVGLQMAALSLRGRPDAGAFVRSFSGSHRYVLDYLVEEVLGRQPKEVQQFLLRTSILERLCGPLCDALLAGDAGPDSEGDDRAAGPESRFLDPSASVLEYLERANLFLVPLDDERVWYRYHHLFADLLRAQLQRALGAQGVARLHLRASEWHGQNGSVLDAIHHASMAADDERVERLIEGNYAEMVNRGEMSWLRAWTGELSRDLVVRRPWLCIYEAMSHAWFGELDEADLLLEEAGRGIRPQTSAPDAQAMLGHLAYVASRVTAMRGDLRRAVELCLEARRLFPSSNLAMHLDISMTLGYEYFLDGDYGNAGPTLQETIRSGIAAGSIINTVAGHCVLARLVAVRGQLKESYDLYQAAGQLIAEASGQHLGAKALVEIGTADLLCEWNDLDAALVHVKQGLALMPWWGKTDDFVLAYITLARIHLARGKVGDAAEAVEEAAGLIQTRGVFPEARRAVEAARVRLWLAQGDLQAANRWAVSQEERLSPGGRFGFENELAHLARMRVSAALKRPAEAIDLSSHLQESARSAGRMGRVAEILLLRALAMQEMGDSEQAMLALTECLTLAEPERYARVFLDEGAPLAELLRLGTRRRAWTEPSLVAHVQRLSAAFSAAAPGSALQLPTSNLRLPTSNLQLPTSSLIEPLSERELEVLRLVAAGRSNQQIADELILAIGTVKSHIHNIYGKLGAANRAQAVTRAGELNLL